MKRSASQQPRMFKLQNNILNQAESEKDRLKKKGYECSIKKIKDNEGDGFDVTCHKPENARDTRSAKFFTEGSYNPRVFEKMRGLQQYTC